MNKEINLNQEIEELRKIKISINEIKRNYQNINENWGIKKDVRELISILDKIYIEIFNDTQKLKLFRMYGEIYLPAISKIISRYSKFKSKNIKSEDVEKLLNNIEETLNKLKKHFQDKYNSFFESEVIDLDAEIKVLLKEINNK